MASTIPVNGPILPEDSGNVPIVENKNKPIDISTFHPKIQKFFAGKESKIRMIDDWIILETLGIGGYSKVKLGLHKTTGQRAALKLMFADQSGKMSSSKKKQLLRELAVMKKVNHVNVIKLISFNENAQYPEATGKHTPCIMTALECATGGELFDYLMYTGHFDDASTRSYFKQMIDGLEAMHSVGIAHRDLKPENLLLDSSFTLKIADFGFATEFKDEKGKETLMKTPCGTKNYLAPEFWLGLDYSYKRDIFAVGMILFTVYAGFPPFMEAQPNDWWWDKYTIAIDKIRRANELKAMMIKNPALKNAASAEYQEMAACLNDAKNRMRLFWKAHSKKRKFEDDDFKDIALNLIHPNPDKRMEISQMRKHVWFVKGPFYNNEQLRMYLTKRVRAAVQGRATKIRTIMEQQIREQQTGPMRGDGDKMDAIQRRMKEIDPKGLFDENVNDVNDDVFVNTLYQFYTYKSPSEIAVRIERAATKLTAVCNIIPEENSITMECGAPIKVPTLNDDKYIETLEKVLFCVKIFVVDGMDKVKECKEKKQKLSEIKDIKYLVSFKRLQGTNESFSMVANKFFSFPQVAEAMVWENLDSNADNDLGLGDDDVKKNDE